MQMVENLEVELNMFSTRKMKRDASKSALDNLLDEHEFHPVAGYIMQQMEGLMPELSYKTLQRYKVLDKVAHSTVDGFEYITGVYQLDVEAPEPKYENNWEYLSEIYSVQQ